MAFSSAVSAKHSFPISSRPSENSTSVRALQPLNVYACSFFSVDGRRTRVIPLGENASFPTSLPPSGKITVFSLQQQQKAKYPIVVRLGGKSIS